MTDQPTTPPAAEPDTKPVIFMLYQNSEYINGTKQYRVAAAPTLSEINPNKTRVFGKMPIKGIKPGSVYTMRGEFNADGGLTAYMSTAKFATVWADQQKVYEWYALDRAAAAAISAANNVKKLIEASSLNEALRPIRAAYQDLSAQQRTLLLADVINFITRG